MRRFLNRDFVRLWKGLFCLYRDCPLRRVECHVFHLERRGRRCWINVSNDVTTEVAFYFDSYNLEYKIVAVQGIKALINYTVNANSRILRTSRKFVQWSDLRTKLVYGLGFDEEEVLCQFLETFYDVRDSIRLGKKFRPRHFRSRHQQQQQQPKVGKNDKRFKIHKFEQKNGVNETKNDELEELQQNLTSTENIRNFLDFENILTSDTDGDSDEAQSQCSDSHACNADHHCTNKMQGNGYDVVVDKSQIEVSRLLSGCDVTTSETSSSIYPKIESSEMIFVHQNGNGFVKLDDHLLAKISRPELEYDVTATIETGNDATVDTENDITARVITRKGVTASNVAEKDVPDEVVTKNDVAAKVETGNDVTALLVSENDITATAITGKDVTASNVAEKTVPDKVVTKNDVAAKVETGNDVIATVVTENDITARVITGKHVTASDVAGKDSTAKIETERDIRATVLTDCDVTARVVVTGNPVTATVDTGKDVTVSDVTVKDVSPTILDNYDVTATDSSKSGSVTEGQDTDHILTYLTQLGRYDKDKTGSDADLSRKPETEFNLVETRVNSEVFGSNLDPNETVIAEHTCQNFAGNGISNESDVDDGGVLIYSPDKDEVAAGSDVISMQRSEESCKDDHGVEFRPFDENCSTMLNENSKESNFATQVKETEIETLFGREFLTEEIDKQLSSNVKSHPVEGRTNGEPLFISSDHTRLLHEPMDEIKPVLINGRSTEELFSEIFGLRVALARLENDLTMSLQMQHDQLKALNGLSNGLAASITSLTDLHTQILNILQSCARKRGGNFS